MPSSLARSVCASRTSLSLAYEVWIRFKSLRYASCGLTPE